MKEPPGRVWANSLAAGEKLGRGSAQPRDAAGPPLPEECAGQGGGCPRSQLGVCCSCCSMALPYHISTCVSQKRGFALTHSCQLLNSSTKWGTRNPPFKSWSKTKSGNSHIINPSSATGGKSLLFSALCPYPLLQSALGAVWVPCVEEHHRWWMVP